MWSYAFQEPPGISTEPHEEVCDGDVHDNALEQEVLDEDIEEWRTNGIKVSTNLCYFQFGPVCLGL